LQELYVNIGWPLYRKYGHAFEVRIWSSSFWRFFLFDMLCTTQGIDMQAFKIMVNDPDSVLDPLTREVKETGPDGQEVTIVW
jgi:translation initiation factor 2 subunit 1